MGDITGDYLWHMEDVLQQYQLPYDAQHPLICFDERPCFLIEEVGGILPLSPGKAKRYHYEYKKNGSCCVFLAFEPHRGGRYVEIRERRTAKDYAEFMQTLLARHYSHAESIRLVQDNLNTHTPGSFYEILPAPEAFALAQRFEPHYTPKKGSWLNMAEVEFAALSKQCLDRRIPEVETLRGEVEAWAERRNQAKKTVQWTFWQPDARQKFHRHYDNVQKFM
jgi:DDE superfamily endonuclease